MARKRLGIMAGAPQYNAVRVIVHRALIDTVAIDLIPSVQWQTSHAAWQHSWMICMITRHNDDLSLMSASSRCRIFSRFILKLEVMFWILRNKLKFLQAKLAKMFGIFYVWLYGTCSVLCGMELGREGDVVEVWLFEFFSHIPSDVTY